jgi:ATP-binding cassette subfamily B protein
MNSFPFYRQLNTMDCGPTCLKMIAKHYGKHFSSERLRKLIGNNKMGSSLYGLSETAEVLGLTTTGLKLTYTQLLDTPVPCILHWDQNHFVVLVSASSKKIKIANPASCISNYTKDEFCKHWISTSDNNSNDLGTVLVLEPTPLFYKQLSDLDNKNFNWKFIGKYLLTARTYIVQVFLSLLVTSLLTFFIPFLTQNAVDKGISRKDLSFLEMILIGQIVFVFSHTIIGFVRSKILLRISNIMNFQILYSFWSKLTKIPISYFDLKQTGDTLQRIEDHKTIQQFLTGNALNTLFSLLTFGIYSVLLAMYNQVLFLIFITGTTIYLFWVRLFANTRNRLNYENFHLSAKENNTTLQFIQGMQEIRLNNAENQKKSEWAKLQYDIFKIGLQSLNVSQTQSAGGTFITQLQGLILSFLVAKLVISNTLTLGAMIAIQYMLGQLTGPVQQWIGFVQGLQDAKISLKRLNEIHELPDEENQITPLKSELPKDKSIIIKNLTFSYPGTYGESVLSNVSFFIPQHKTTAVVGMSGSGKTTLLKILLKVYDEYSGDIMVGEYCVDNNINDFSKISHSYWRSKVGAVLQDGFIFNDTIIRNIAVGDENINFERLCESCRVANINSFIESLPNKFFTKLGADGMSLSMGQRQRILIARAVYKNPEYIFFDEATNALDATNEKIILENLANVFDKKTVIIVAHRLSTVMNAHQIIVLEKGKIVEVGNHQELLLLKGKYYELVKNQLELVG